MRGNLVAEKIIVLTIANKGVGLALTNALVASSKKVPTIDPSGKELALSGSREAKCLSGYFNAV
jgi:hypothetical protein